MEKGAVRPRGPTAPTLLPACAHQDKAVNARLLAQIAFIVAAAFVGVIGSGLDGSLGVQRLLLGLADILRSPFQRIVPNGLTVYVPSYALSMI